jgi:prepilin-type processing-associated H-X9-DG protein
MRTAFVLSASLLISTAVLGAEEPRFRPDACFPDGILHASVASVSRLEERLAATLLGRMATHPGVRKAFAGLDALVKEKSAASGAAAARVTGKTPLELLGLIRGEAALHVGISPGGPPVVAIALELGPTREAILEVRGRLRDAAGEMTGAPLETVTIEGLEATAWPGPAGPILDGVLGTHLVIASTRDLFASIAKAYRTRPERQEPLEARLDPDLARDLAVSDREALLLIDVQALRGVILGHAPAHARQDIEKVLRVAGLDRVTSLGGALGFREGGAESAWRLGMKDGPGGILGVLARSLPGLGDLDPALARMPAAALEVQAGRIDLGGLLRGIDGVVREALGPEVDLDAGYAELERAVGVSVKEDLFTLGVIAAQSFSVKPPAGGLFPDEIVLVESSSVERCSKLLDKLARKLGVESRAIGPAGGVSYLNLMDGAIVECLRGELLGSQSRGTWTPNPFELLTMAASAGVASADIGDGWKAVSTLPQAIVRHIEIHSKEPRLASASEGAELAALVRREARGAAAILVSRGGGTGILALYNSILPVAIALYPVLKAVGVDPAELPPAESFSGDVKPGYLRLAVDAKGFTLRGHRILETRAGMLAGLGFGAAAAGFIVPTLQTGRAEAFTVQCQSNLKQLYSIALLYSDKSGTRAYPHSEAGSVASLQVLIDAHPESLTRSLFVCPNHGAGVPVEEDGRIVLTPETTSYEVVPWRVRNTAPNAILIYDREPVHGGRRNVLFSDGSVRSMHEGEFQKALAENRERSSKDEFAPRKPAGKKKAAKKKPAKEKAAE